MDRPLLPFVAIATIQKKSGSRKKNVVVIESSYTAIHPAQPNTEQSYLKFVHEKLSNVSEDNFMTYYDDWTLGHWFMKGIQGVVYIICTTIDYPKFIAIEALDEHFELCKGHVRNKLMAKAAPAKRKQNLDKCCCALSEKWGTMDEGTAAYILMTEVDHTTRAKYSEKVDALLDEVSKVKNQMESNIVNQLQNMENTDRLSQKSQEALEEAMVFKKRTATVRRKMRNRNNSLIAIGTAGSAIGGLVLGSLIGGPVGAAILTPIFAAGFLGASGAMSDWGLSQKFVILKEQVTSSSSSSGGSTTSGTSSSIRSQQSSMTTTTTSASGGGSTN